jgi:hypothetical protein
VAHESSQKRFFVRLVLQSLRCYHGDPGTGAYLLTCALLGNMSWIPWSALTMHTPPKGFVYKGCIGRPRSILG